MNSLREDKWCYKPLQQSELYTTQKRHTDKTRSCNYHRRAFFPLLEGAIVLSIISLSSLQNMPNMFLFSIYILLKFLHQFQSGKYFYLLVVNSPPPIKQARCAGSVKKRLGTAYTLHLVLLLPEFLCDNHKSILKKLLHARWWWHMPLNPALRRQTELCEFKANLTYKSHLQDN